MEYLASAVAIFSESSWTERSGETTVTKTETINVGATGNE